MDELGLLLQSGSLPCIGRISDTFNRTLTLTEEHGVETPSTIAITGGAGFIGSNLIRRIISQTAHSVVNVDSLTYAGNLESLEEAVDSPRYAFAQVDVADRNAFAAVLTRYQPHAVIHLAAESHVDRSIDSPGAFVRTNIEGTYVALEASLDYWSGLDPRESQSFRFLHVSTDEVFGSLEDQAAPSNERSRHAPNSPYAASKAAADHLVRAWHKTYGLPAVTTNCTNNYGAYQFPEKLIPHIVISAIEDKPLPVYGDGAHIRDWLHVKDHVEALLAVLSKGTPGRIYTLGARNPRSNKEVVMAICDALDELQPREDRASYREQMTNVPDRPGHDRRYTIDPSSAESELDWRATTDWSGGLRETVKWYLENEPWWRHILDGSYRVERIGLRS